MTQEGRKRQIEKALTARLERPEAERPSLPLMWSRPNNVEKYFPVIDLPVEVPLLWADSHRIRAELEAPKYEFVRKEKTTDAAQEALRELWKRAHRKFDKLKESLDVEGQTEPGVITREGILINGNTRLVALRELGKQWIRVAVLDSDVRPVELADLELRLQVRETGHDTYRLSNELLFIHEMKSEYKRADKQIARQLNWTPSRPAVGEKKVELYRRMLLLIREMQHRDPRLPITFFDDEEGGSGKLQQLKELEQRYHELITSGDTSAANLLLDTWLVVARCGFASVHQIRAVTRRDNFVDDFLLPRLGEQPLFGDNAEALVRSRRDDVQTPPGVDDLGVGPSDNHEQSAYDLQSLVAMVEAADDERLSIPGSDGKRVAADHVKAAIRSAVQGALRDHRAEDRAEDALDAPVDALRKAAREIRKALDTYRELRGTKEFERQVRGAFEYQFRHLRKNVAALGELIAGKGASGSRR
ncbi:MAG: hypothetical protein HY678_01080 [Chloroflexi bacterium]|nr:hypothetical protein [Chloroflexota bacterium]